MSSLSPKLVAYTKREAATLNEFVRRNKSELVQVFGPLPQRWRTTNVPHPIVGGQSRNQASAAINEGALGERGRRSERVP
jgi:hypothetical protein